MFEQQFSLIENECKLQIYCKIVENANTNEMI